MRRFSQKNHLVTLNEINITPLLDLAFVLLIIFVITRPALEQSMEMQLPAAGKQTAVAESKKKNIHTVEIGQTGEFRFEGQTVPAAKLEQLLVQHFRKNPHIIVNIRADKRAQWDHVARIMGMCMRNGITQVAPQTAPER